MLRYICAKFLPENIFNCLFNYYDYLEYRHILKIFIIVYNILHCRKKEHQVLHQNPFQSK